MRIDNETSEAEGGRFSLVQWSEALEQVGSDFAVHHLITAGVMPDAVEPGLAGDPEGSANIRALRGYKCSIFHCGEDGGVCTALLAYASRHLSGEHLEDLLARTNPSSTLSAPRSKLRGLPSAEESLRYTFENIGHQVLASIEVPKVWLLDRGLNHGLLLRARHEQFAKQQDLEAHGERF